MSTHTLKMETRWLDRVLSGEKRAEVRLHDRDYQAGDDHSCGGGLHTCPTPRMARDHYPNASRFLEASVPLADLRPIDDTKAKSPTVTVVREVDIDGEPIGGAR